jgi:hypothetical protein
MSDLSLGCAPKRTVADPLNFAPSYIIRSRAAHGLLRPSTNLLHCHRRRYACGDPVSLFSCLLWGWVVGGSMAGLTLLQSLGLFVVLMALVLGAHALDKNKVTLRQIWLALMRRKRKVDKP